MSKTGLITINITPRLRRHIIRKLALADGQDITGFDLDHTAEVMYGAMADAVLEGLQEIAQ